MAKSIELNANVGLKLYIRKCRDKSNKTYFQVSNNKDDSQTRIEWNIIRNNPESLIKFNRGIKTILDKYSEYGEFTAEFLSSSYMICSNHIKMARELNREQFRQKVTFDYTNLSITVKEEKRWVEIFKEWKFQMIANYQLQEKYAS